MTKAFLPLDPKPAITSFPLLHSENFTIKHQNTERILVSPDTTYTRTIAADAAGIFQQMLGLNTTPALEYYPDEATMVAAFQQNYSKIAGYLFVIKLTLSLDVTMYYLGMKWLILVIDLYRFDPDKSANHEQ